ncbi:thioredoxin family protein [Allosaccharopolyspora coralli]|uniref:Thioredoxin family protein n=1 Tax=Allosaccharopolyspora coralli TaxID=2665642 RepID=A0A5Q3QFM1_9PSEU|nr:glutaredoxin family protein [Allosaccharopolyspora coralli]QGK70259.1 thioredoxin family protein [Allosaccharopolyspora coralli]
MTTHVTLLTQADCHLCEHAQQVLDRVSREYPLSITEVDLRTTEGHQLAAEAGVLFAPGVLLDDEPFAYGRLSERKLRKTLNTRATRAR